MPENNNTYDMPFPKRLRLLLDETGVSQQELADFVGVKRQTIAQWKDGKTVPDINNFQKVAQYFSVPYEYLLGDTGSRVRENFHLERTLGLSDGAIKALMAMRDAEADNHEPMSKLVSYILQDERFITAITHFQNFLEESLLMFMREYNPQYVEEVSIEVDQAAKLLRMVGIAVMDADSMKSFHFEQAKAAFGKAIEAIEEKMQTEREQELAALFPGRDIKKLNNKFLDIIKGEAAKWQQLQNEARATRSLYPADTTPKENR